MKSIASIMGETKSFREYVEGIDEIPAKGKRGPNLRKKKFSKLNRLFTILNGVYSEAYHDGAHDAGMDSPGFNT